MKRLLAPLGSLFLCLWLAACATQAPLPVSPPDLELPLQLKITRESPTPDDEILVIQAEGEALRWSLLDPMGAPRARLLLQSGEWHADGLLPPNPEARELFAALLFALSDDTELSERYPEADWRVDGDERAMLVKGKPRWQVVFGDAGSLKLVINGDATYRVARLDEGATP